MRTAIKSLEIIKEMYEYFVKKYRGLEPNLMICEKEDFDNVEKHLKALEIIKEKGNFISLEYDEYNDKYYIYDNELYMHNEITKEEYDLLKEVLL